MIDGQRGQRSHCYYRRWTALRVASAEKKDMSTCDDCETFRIPPLMSTRTIRIPDEGAGCWVVGTYVCGAATV